MGEQSVTFPVDGLFDAVFHVLGVDSRVWMNWETRTDCIPRRGDWFSYAPGRVYEVERVLWSFPSPDGFKAVDVYAVEVSGSRLNALEEYPLRCRT